MNTRRVPDRWPITGPRGHRGHDGRSGHRPPHLLPRAATACVAAVLLTACGPQDAGSPPAPGTAPAEVGSPAATSAGYVQPPFVELPPDAPDRPGDDLVDWRRQVRESIQRHPGTFGAPQQLPADITVAFTSTWWEHPVLDVMSDGSGVIVCADELPACEAALGGAPVVLVRSGEVDSRTFHVLRKPPAEPGTTGELTTAQQRFWATVPFTTTVPDWATDAA